VPSLFIGIDPGEHGGIAVIGYTGQVVAFHSMPPDRRAIRAWVAGAVDRVGSCADAVACVEKVGGYQKGSEGNIGSSMFVFGMAFERALGVLDFLDIPTTEVASRTWQKALGIPKRKPEASDSQWKNQLKLTAQQLFPRIVVTLDTADALLIAHYCYLTRKG
jgi:hypothetical protein